MRSGKGKEPYEGPWVRRKDEKLGRWFEFCKHCASYTEVLDQIEFRYRLSSFPRLLRPAVRFVLNLGLLLRSLRFMLKHLTCGAIWIEDK